MLSSFEKDTISVSEATKDFRPWDRTIIDWEVEYQGYQRTEDGDQEGFIDFHIIVGIMESLVKARDKKSYKKIKVSGYKIIVTQNFALPGESWESWVLHVEEFKKKDISKAYDAFQRELLNIQTWIEIAESRANLIPFGKDAFECMHCGWVTDKISDDIMCPGCGKRYWSEKLWGNGDMR